MCCFGRKSTIEEQDKVTENENEPKQIEQEKSPASEPSVKESLLSLKFLAICIYATIAQTRMNSIPGWTYSWLQERIKFHCPSELYQKQAESKLNDLKVNCHKLLG